MLPKSKSLLKIIKICKDFLKKENILDIIIFGSAVKGKEKLEEVDLAIIFKEIKKDLIDEFNKKTKNLKIETHLSTVNIKDFFRKPPPLINTILREGFSLRNNKPLAQGYDFSSCLMYIYQLKGMKATEKVKFIYLLRGRTGEKGFIEKNKGKWLAKQVFIIPLEKEKDIEEIMKKFKIKYQKHFLLIH